MEVWIDEKKPEVLSTTNVVLALAVHLAFFIAVFVFANFHFKPKETIIPIDLTVVVNENLDGVEDEPPPLDDPPPEPPKPDPTPVEPTPPPPPPPVEEKLDAVVKVPEKKPEEKKPEKPKETLEERMKRMRESAKAPEKKKPEEKKPEKPKKTKEELLKERMAKMRESAKPVKIKVKDRPSGNGRTERQTMTEAQIRNLLNKGYTAGKKTQIATSTMQYCISRVQKAIDARWSQVNPRVGSEGYVYIAVRFNMSGRMVNCRLSESCGDRTSDAAALTVVRTVGNIGGLDRDFLKEFSKQDLVIRYKVVSR